jgi:hypothetical protein
MYEIRLNVALSAIQRQLNRPYKPAVEKDFSLNISYFILQH